MYTGPEFLAAMRAGRFRLSELAGNRWHVELTVTGAENAIEDLHTDLGEAIRTARELGKPSNGGMKYVVRDARTGYVVWDDSPKFVVLMFQENPQSLDAYWLAKVGVYTDGDSAGEAAMEHTEASEKDCRAVLIEELHNYSPVIWER